ncbi:MAG: hypothetical protein KME17_13445 [Cyanosarcina radialis HA8281-LM2]|jgi:hypothetical protein|nr:hypothetical protein [Cyanosarcina radialis HA8281-LM2]
MGEGGEGRWGDGEMGRWGDGEMGRWGDGEMGRWGDGEREERARAREKEILNSKLSFHSTLNTQHLTLPKFLNFLIIV